MKYVFIHPPGEKVWKAKQRYSIIKRTLHQRYNLDAVLIDSSALRGKTQDLNLLCTDADVIVLHVQSCQDTAQMIQHWKARDKIVIVDIPIPVVLDSNSNRYLLGCSMTARSDDLSVAYSTVNRDTLIWIVKLADGVIVNSRQLFDDWTGISRVIHMPDYLDMDQYLIHPYEAHQGIYIGIQVSEGGLQKVKDCGLLPALESIGSRYPQTRMIFHGVSSDKAHEIHLAAQQKMLISAHDPANWMAVLPSLDIGVVPKLNVFDQRSGREEILELMMMKVPWAASSGVCCRELGQYGWLVQNNLGTWERILDDMIINLDTYRAESTEGYLFALGQGIDENIDKLLSACYSIRTDIYSGVG